MRKFGGKKKKKLQFWKKRFGSDTEIGLWFWFLLPKFGFGRTLAVSVCRYAVHFSAAYKLALNF